MIDKIPRGIYCYEILAINQQNGHITTKICPFWQRVDQYNGKCNYLNIDDESSKGISHLWDQLKECEVNL